MKNVRPFTDPEYALLVLTNWKRMIHRTDFWKAFTPPRNILERDTADSSEVCNALDHAIEAIRREVQE